MLTSIDNFRSVRGSASPPRSCPSDRRLLWCQRNRHRRKEMLLWEILAPQSKTFPLEFKDPDHSVFVQWCYTRRRDEGTGTSPTAAIGRRHAADQSLQAAISWSLRPPFLHNTPGKKTIRTYENGRTFFYFVSSSHNSDIDVSDTGNVEWYNGIFLEKTKKTTLRVKYCRPCHA